MIARDRRLRTLHARRKSQAHYAGAREGQVGAGRKRIDVPLRTDIRVGGERTVKAHESGKEAVSVFKPVQFFAKKASLVEVELETGRTHQIRVHAACGLSARGRQCGEEEFNETMKAWGSRACSCTRTA